MQLLGHPIEHSLSPQLFNTAFKDQGIDATYESLDVLPEDLRTFIDSLKIEDKYHGLSVTIPHKEVLKNILQEISQEAKDIGAVNTVYRKDKTIFGENTDWKGVQYSFRNIPEIYKKNILLLGAGGAARACIYGLQKMGAQRISVWNRTPERGRKLAEDFGISFTDEFREESDIIINSTSIGLNEVDISPIPNELLANARYVMDMVYRETDLLRRAKENGAVTIDGREMLLGQALEQFRFFTEMEPPEEIMREIAYEKVASDYDDEMKIK